MTVLVTTLAVVVALLAVLVVGLLRSHAEILRSLHELGVDLDPDRAGGDGGPRRRPAGLEVPRPQTGTRSAADVAGRTPAGDAVSIAVVGATEPTLLAFLTSGCTTCAGFWTAMSSPRRRRVPGDARLVVVTKGEEGESPALLQRFAPPDVPVVMSSTAWTDYDVPVAPYFAYVDGPSGTVIGEGAAGTWEHLVSMIEQARADAGLPADAPGRRRRRRRADSPARADAALRRSGIEPGDPSLYGAEPHDDPDDGT